MLSRLIRYGASTSVSIIPPPRPCVSYLRSFSSNSTSSVFGEIMKNLRNCPPVTTTSSKSKTNNIDPIVVISCELTGMAVSQFEFMLCTRGLYSISDYNYILSSLSSQGYSNTILRLARLWDESLTHNNVFPNVDT